MVLVECKHNFGLLQMVFSESFVVDFLKILPRDAMVDLDACNEDVALSNGSLSKGSMEEGASLVCF